MRIHRRLPLPLLVLLALAALQPRRRLPLPAAPAGGRGGPAQPRASTIVTLADARRSSCRPTSSRPCARCNSTTVQPQVEGRVTKIFVKSGDQRHAPARRSSRSTPRRQAATVRNTESQRAGARGGRHLLEEPGRAAAVAAQGRRDQPERVRHGAAQPRRRAGATSPRSTRRSAKDASSCSTTASPPPRRASSATSRCARAIASRPRP